MSKINVLLVDDATVVAEGLQRLFDTCETINYRGCVKTPEACLKRVETDHRMIDVILMDINFPDSDMDGMQLARKLREDRPFVIEDGQISAPRIVFFSVAGGFVDVENGIQGVISKQEDFKNIVWMLEKVHKGATFPPDIPANDVPDLWKKFSPSEEEVFCLVMKGFSTSDIVEERKPNKADITILKRKILKKIRKSGLKVDKINASSIIRSFPKKLETLSFWGELNTKEKDIVRLILEGKTDEDLSDFLKPSQHTVTTQRRDILTKIKNAYPDVERIDDPRMVQLVLKHKLCSIDSLD